MDWNIVWLGVIAISMVIFSVSVVILVAYVVPLLSSLRATSHKLDQTLDRIQGIAYELEQITSRIRKLEERVARTVDPLLDQTLPPIRGLTAVLAGVRTGLVALATWKKNDSPASGGA
jgi:uncharacterized protein YoxC